MAPRTQQGGGTAVMQSFYLQPIDDPKETPETTKGVLRAARIIKWLVKDLKEQKMPAETLLGVVVEVERAVRP